MPARRSRLSQMRSLSLLLLVISTALASVASAGPIELVDDIGTRIALASPARRIVSLAPHVTELLFAAGAGERVVGAVEYSDHPARARELPRIGRYSALDLEAIAALRPDLAVAWMSGNRDVHLERLRALGIPVFVSEARSLEDVARSLEQIGRLAGTERTAASAAAAFRERRDALAAKYGSEPTVRMFYEIWNAPLMTINGEHLISAIMRLCGGRNVFADLEPLAPNINEEAVIALDPEVIVASGMDEARPQWLDDWRRWRSLTAVSRGNLFFIPPDLMQRHTPRALDGAAQLCEQLALARTRRAAQGR